jgi:hypothetical protein
MKEIDKKIKMILDLFYVMERRKDERRAWKKRVMKFDDDQLLSSILMR